MKSMSEPVTEAKAAPTPHDEPYFALAPTRWWRWVSSGRFEAVSLKDMKVAVAMMPVPGGPRWSEAAAGDASAAIGLVLGTDLRRMDPYKRDLAMTLLVICALEGSDAACVVLSHAIRRTPGAGPREAHIATSWLVHAFGKILSTGTGRRPARKGAIR